MAAKKLPRLGSSEAVKPTPKTVEVELSDRGASVVLRKPSVGMVIDLQDAFDKADEDAQAGLTASVALISRMLVEPELGEEELREEVSDWSFDDFQTLQSEAMKLAGLSEEEQRSTRSEFQGKGS